MAREVRDVYFWSGEEPASNDLISKHPVFGKIQMITPIDFTPSGSRPPSIGDIMESASAVLAVKRFGRHATISAVRTVVLERKQQREALPCSAEELGSKAFAKLEAGMRLHLKPVFNLTGVILHTNLGRAILSEEAIAAAIEAMRKPVALEFDLETGDRGERDDHIRGIVCELTGAEDATVVNNNAAAILLALNSLARGKESIVSRGELIEIGGAFRLPEIMNRASTKLKEVGTTNRTHEKDYTAAVGSRAGLVLKVHTSNYVIKGFTREVGIKELAAIAERASIPLVCDLGSGTLMSLERFGLPHEMTVTEALKAGADLVTFSGDKLLGGPQTGFIVGKKDLIQKINKNPMKRAMRVDKIRLAALEATLRAYRDSDRLAEKLPTYRFLAKSVNDIRATAERMLAAISPKLRSLFETTVCDCESEIGSGASPLEKITSAGIAIRSQRKRDGSRLRKLSAAFRSLPTPVVGRIANNAIILDMRCLEDEDEFVRNFAHIDLTGLEA